MENQNLPAVVIRAITEQKIILDQVNMMLPTQSYGVVMGEYDRIMIEIVKIDPDPKNGEVFEIGGKLSLGKVPVDKIGSGLGIIWDPDQTGIIESTPTKSRAKATGALKKPNGEWIVMSEEKTVDLEALTERERMSIEDKAEKGDFNNITGWGTTKNGKKYPIFAEWKSEQAKKEGIELALKKAMLSYRIFKDERAMTGARERCIKALVALKGTYSAEELEKPFAFPRIITDTNKLLNNAEGRRLAIERATGAAASIFGVNKPTQHVDNNMDFKSLAIGNTIHAEAEIVDDSAPEDIFALAPDPEPEEDKDPAQTEMEELVKYIKDALKQIGGEAETRGLAWFATKEAGNLDVLREKKAALEAYIAKHAGKGAA